MSTGEWNALDRLAPYVWDKANTRPRKLLKYPQSSSNLKGNRPRLLPRKLKMIMETQLVLYCNWEVYLHQRLQGYPQNLCPFIWWGWRALDRSTWDTTDGTGSGMDYSLRSKSKWCHSIVPSNGPDAFTLSQCRVDGHYGKVWQEEPQPYYQELGEVQDLCHCFYYQSRLQTRCLRQAKELSAGACQALWFERQGMVLATRDHQSNNALVSSKCTQGPEGNSSHF